MHTKKVRSINCHLSRWFALCAISFFLAIAQAQYSSTTSGSGSSSASALSPGLAYQVHSLPLNGSQLLGPEMSYRILGGTRLGGRYLLSPTRKDEQRINVFWKIPLSDHYYHFVVEPQYSYLTRPGASGGDFSTTGFSFGYEGMVGRSTTAGLLLGAEKSGPAFPVGPVWDRPYVILFTNFSF